MISIRGYNIEPGLRIDRNDTVKGIGGGIVVYTKSGLSVKTEQVENNFNQYCRFTVMNSSNTKNLEITAIYRSPNSTWENTESMMELINSSGENSIIIGDLNIPTIDWMKGTTG